MRITPGIKILVLVIIITTSALRLYDLFHIPFTYDELSALFRTHYDSFSDLIRYGVRIDGHPAGIQVFLFYITKLVGFSEGWLKLPFILAGIASVYLIWKIGHEWFSPQVGLLAAATLAFMHYTIVYSQIARPYGSGIFFTLLMLLGWSRMVMTKKGNYWKNFALFVMGSVLCTYNHHFTLLMVVLTSLAGLFMVRGKELKRYLLAGVIIIVCYIPHIPITLYQLSMGGVEQWLNKPTPQFFVDYGKYIFHFSKITALAFAVAVIYGIINSVARKNFRIRQPQIIALIFGTAPIITGYLYSVHIAAVLQFSVLLFSFPMLVLFVFSFYEKVSLRQTIGITIVWSILLIHSLIWTRDHFEYFYHSPFEESTKEIKAFTQTHPVDSTLVLCTYRSEVADLYRDKFDINPKLKYVFTDSLKSTLELHTYFSDSAYRYLIIAKTNETIPWLYAISHEYFAVSLAETNYNQGSCIIMEKGDAHYMNYFSGSICDFGKSSTIQWTFNTTKVLKDTLNSIRVLKIDEEVEFEASWMKNATGFIRSRANVIDATVWVYLPDSLKSEALWVASLEADTGVVTWNASPINVNTVPLRKWAPVSVSIFLPDIRRIPENAKVKVYLYNPNKSVFYIRQTFAGIRAGNPSIYWITYGIFD